MVDYNNIALHIQLSVQLNFFRICESGIIIRILCDSLHFILFELPYIDVYEQLT